MEYNVICFMLCIKTEDFHEDIVRHVVEKFNGIKEPYQWGKTKQLRSLLKYAVDKKIMK